MGEHGLQEDGARDRREYSRRVEQKRLEGNVDAPEFKRGWRLGAEDFVEQLAERLGRAGSSGERARERRETDEQLALRIVRVAMAKAGLKEEELGGMAKGDRRKVKIARQLRGETPMTREWIARRLSMGSASYLSALLAGLDDSKL